MTADAAPAGGDPPDETVPPSLRQGPPRLLVFAAIVLIVAATAAVGMLLSTRKAAPSRPSGSGALHEFTIPPGSFQKVAAGQDPDVIPAELHVSVGDTIEIHNDDVVGQTVGPYYVPSGQTVQQTFTEDATLEGACTAHKDGRIRIVVGTGGREVTQPAA